MNQEQRNAWIESAKDMVLRNAKESDKTEAELMMLYDECAYQLETEIRAFYSKYAKESGITLMQAEAALSGAELNRFRKSAKEYVEEISKQGKDSWIYREYQLLSVKSRVSRKEQLLAVMYRNMLHLAGKSETELSELLSGIVRTNFERKSFSIQSISGIAFPVGNLDEGLLRRVLSHPWSGKRYSEVVWGNTDKLAASVKRELSIGLATGASVERMAAEVAETMKSSRYAARRVVRTESSYFANQGQILAYQEAGIKNYRYVGGGCPDCAALSGLVFPVAEAETGVNFPPLHPNCRCTTVASSDIPVFRKRSGNPLKSNSRFEEWKKKHMQYENSYIHPEELRDIAKLGDSATIKTGARIVDPYSDSAMEFAKSYYGNIRKSKTDVKKIAKVLKVEENLIKTIKEYLFLEKSYYNDDTGEWEQFYPDCAIAQSWQRLSSGRKSEILPHDITLIEHERYEMELKRKNPEISHVEAHRRTNLKYPYQKEAEQYYGSLKEHQKRK